MRVIAGKRKGKKLLGFDGDFIRPTTDRVKESMFNLITGYVAGAKVYDAFCGSGALSIEALSRGAVFAVCTDTDDRSVRIAESNFKDCGFDDMHRIVKTSAPAFLETCGDVFDLVFMDPPYNKGLVTPVLEVMSRRGLLSDDGIIVIERDGVDDGFESFDFQTVKERKYGRTVVTVLKKL